MSDIPRRLCRVSRTGNRPAYHQDICARGKRLDRSHHPALVAQRASGGTNARHDQEEIRAQFLAQTRMTPGAYRAEHTTPSRPQCRDSVASRKT